MQLKETGQVQGDGQGLGKPSSAQNAAIAGPTMTSQASLALACWHMKQLSQAAEDVECRQVSQGGQEEAVALDW